MVNDISWHDFGAQTDALVAELMRSMRVPMFAFNRMLSVVMPGHQIEAHCDSQQSDWITRVHVPLQTNDQAVMCVEGVDYRMDVGVAYRFDTRREHAVRNGGDTPRIHFMFDVRH